MKIVPLFLAVSLVISCKEIKKETDKKTVKSEIKEAPSKKNFPDALASVFDAHGGLAAWKRKGTLTFDIPKEGSGKETHAVDLSSRKDRVELNNITLGFDGKDVWIMDADKSYDGDPNFYHNLMFYFYAMPFVLADEGINYGETEALEFDGKSYPGIKITYNTGVGSSPKDEYFVHYNPETYQMEWLGYTVTYRTGKKSDKVNWIRYDNWMEVEGILLPKSISWFNYENHTLKGVRNTVTFENVTLSETSLPNSFFEKPEGAEIVAPE